MGVPDFLYSRSQISIAFEGREGAEITPDTTRAPIVLAKVAETISKLSQSIE